MSTLKDTEGKEGKEEHKEQKKEDDKHQEQGEEKSRSIFKVKRKFQMNLRHIGA